MADDYGSVRHPLYSIGEGVMSEKEERLRKQGLLKKKKKEEEEKKRLRSLPPPSPPPGQALVEDNMWMPVSLSGSNLNLTSPSGPSIMDKIWGTKKQKKKTK